MSSGVFNIGTHTVSESTYLFNVSVNEQHSVFAGHFPSQPVVPGVCTLAMVKECVSKIVLRSLRFSYIRECKFLSAIVPGEHSELVVKIVIKDDATGLNLVAEVMTESATMMKLKSTMSYND